MNKISFNVFSDLGGTLAYSAEQGGVSPRLDLPDGIIDRDQSLGLLEVQQFDHLPVHADDTFAPVFGYRERLDHGLRVTELGLFSDFAVATVMNFCKQSLLGLVDYYGGEEAIELGPDENMHDSMIERIAGVELERNYDLSAPQGVAGRNSDNTFILEVLGWEPDTPLREGMAETYAWIAEQFAARKAGKRVVTG